ncbi:hypothetical protein [Streptomyces liangshanensis]|uniref:hypothetical protein n=1 Tax=Streptomyces liangshanensis TaxID=2717324 RepID=UPI0036DD56C8
MSTAVAGISGLMVGAAWFLLQQQRQLRREVDDLRAEVAAARIAKALSTDTAGR